MNQKQREYLIQQLEESAKWKIRDLEANRPKEPSLKMALFLAVANGEFETVSTDELRATIKKRAKANPEKFLSSSRAWDNTDDKVDVVFLAREIFKLPKSYLDEKAVYDAAILEYEKQNSLIRTQLETLRTRIMLASNKTLEKMINEVDSMGEISLFDNSIKLLAK